MFSCWLFHLNKQFCLWSLSSLSGSRYLHYHINDLNAEKIMIGNVNKTIAVLSVFCLWSVRRFNTCMASGRSLLMCILGTVIKFSHVLLWGSLVVTYLPRTTGCCKRVASVW